MLVSVRAWVAMAVLSSGCGLTLDLAPVDPEGMDAQIAADAGTDAMPSDSGFDARVVVDAGLVDATLVDDAGPDAALAIDGGTVETDAGRDAGVVVVDADVEPLDCESTCTAPGFYCVRPAGRCLGPATCVPLPTETCSTIVEPVCGCDRRTYSNGCAAARAGVNVAQTGACPSFAAGTNWCARTPEPSGTVGCERCFDDADCGSFFPRCIGSACVEGGEGQCAAFGGASTCYYDSDCGDDDERCEGAAVRDCDPDDPIAYVQGTCR